MQKIIDKREFKDHRKGEVIVKKTDTGVHAVKIEHLFMLALDDDDLKLTEWDEFRDALIEDGVITQSDIDKEKEKPEIKKKIKEFKLKVKNNPK